MKKMFTLVSGLLLAVAVMAADRRPVVMVSSMKNYKIFIDGRTYFSNDNSLRISHLNKGFHSIKVFEMRRGYFERRERLVASKTFNLRRHDVRILIDRFGNISIREINGHGRFDRDDDYRDRDRWEDDNRRF